jgi:hypothetical protein
MVHKQNIHASVLNPTPAKGPIRESGDSSDILLFESYKVSLFGPINHKSQTIHGLCKNIQIDLG